MVGKYPSSNKLVDSNEPVQYQKITVAFQRDKQTEK